MFQGFNGALTRCRENDSEQRMSALVNVLFEEELIINNST